MKWKVQFGAGLFSCNSNPARLVVRVNELLNELGCGCRVASTTYGDVKRQFAGVVGDHGDFFVCVSDVLDDWEWCVGIVAECVKE